MRRASWRGVLALVAMVSVTLARTADAQSVSVWLTTPDRSSLLAPQSPVAFSGDPAPDLPIVDVDDTQQFQVMEGIGASFTDSSAWVMAQVDDATRAQVMSALFDANAGIGLSFLRQPMGASDFARFLYTYDDIDPYGTDYALANFSIDPDRAYILPMLHAALAVNPGLRIMATPWTAPAWMKTTNVLTDGGNLRPDAFGTYAQYFVQFVQAYASEGVPLDSVTVQNEPATAPPYPSMVMTSDDQATFIGQYLGPALAAAGLTTRIFTWDHNWQPDYALAVLGDQAANSVVKGAAFHCYLGTPDAMSAVHDAYPTVAMAVTECSDGSRATFAEKLSYDVRTMIIASIRNWASTVTKWNIVLDQNGGPKSYSRSCINCTGLVTVDTGTGSVSFNEDFYALGHLSKVVRPGALRIASNTFGLGGIEDVAFLNPDGSVVVLAINSGDNPAGFQVRWHGTTFQYALDAGAVATLQWQPSTGATKF
jgi:O-glycosyl hydrolase